MTEGGFLAGPDGMRAALGHVEVKNVIGFTQECVRVEPRSGEEIEGMAEALRTKEKSMISDMLKAFRVKEDSKMMRMMHADDGGGFARGGASSAAVSDGVGAGGVLLSRDVL